MSGFVGTVQLDGAPVDRQLLRQMTEFLSYRGPDALGMWVDGPVGFGHALLRTTKESEREQQPCSLKNKIWLIADARIDGRADLIRKLQSQGCDCTVTIPDSELILRAYEIWGEPCLEHLFGDFSFAIWDQRGHRLFCARDHLGVKPFFYAHAGGSLIFSNTLDCLRLPPGIPDELDDLAIADFLLFDANEDLATTAFAAIRRLPPAHTLTCEASKLFLRRYWTLPREGPVRYKRAADYVEHFRELLDAAVADRLRTNSASILMSGGLDSSTVAASAKGILSGRSASFHLRAQTAVYDHLLPDEERHYADLVAQALGIPIDYLVMDNYRLYERWDHSGLRWPEPSHEPLAAIEADQLRNIASHSRLALTGYGGDPAFSCLLSAHFCKRLAELRLGRLATDLTQFLLSDGRLSRLYVHTRLRRWFSRDRWKNYYPAWLNEDFAKRLDLPARWERMNRPTEPDHPVRPEAYQALTSPLWPCLFEGYDPGVTRLPVEVRHPFFDLRLLRYLLTLGALPWCSDKELLRVAMRGVLPEEVRRRRKTPLQGDPIAACLSNPEASWVDEFLPSPALARYVVRSRVPPVQQESDGWKLWVNLRPLSLNYWLQSRAPVRYKATEEKWDEFKAAQIA